MGADLLITAFVVPPGGPDCAGTLIQTCNWNDDDPAVGTNPRRQ
jgi:hypothetical protein